MSSEGQDWHRIEDCAFYFEADGPSSQLYVVVKTLKKSYHITKYPIQSSRKNAIIIKGVKHEQLKQATTPCKDGCQNQNIVERYRWITPDLQKRRYQCEKCGQWEK
jgi:hypothetical protein